MVENLGKIDSVYYLVALIALLIGVGVMWKFNLPRRKRNSQKSEALALSLRLDRLENKVIEIQRQLERIKFTSYPSERDRQQGSLDELEERLSSVESQLRLMNRYKPENASQHNKTSTKNRISHDSDNVDSNTSMADRDDTKIGPAIRLYKQQSIDLGELFIPLSGYLTALQDGNIAIDERESRNIIDDISREYPGAVRVEQVRGKVGRQIAILDEFLKS